VTDDEVPEVPEVPEILVVHRWRRCGGARAGAWRRAVAAFLPDLPDDFQLHLIDA